MAGDRRAHKFPETCDTETPNLFNLMMKNRPSATLVSLIVLLFSLPPGVCVPPTYLERIQSLIGTMTYDRVLDPFTSICYSFSLVRLRIGSRAEKMRRKIVEFLTSRVIFVPWTRFTKVAAICSGVMSRGNMGKRLKLEIRIYSLASNITDCYTRNLLCTDNLNTWYSVV